ncbi:DNA mismatch repair protein MutS [Halosimplex litoreum]|uniref:DNA mismatch repair protein MutS n=1 Tax=Halosimplex litoreum TaxID=1198301 RepID=A0A7T3FZS7_9EURY|nr:DNA mismatch repair protein MutS [Halosimplex litoreum]QPV63738.1 DNA mismatch repair protein MutS [Halosimplex litoreum]
MDAALGAPAKMAEREDDLTPMMAQYFELCREYDDSLVLFQVGDFYEAFCEAAERVARICEITLTKREDSTGEYAMSGIPIDNAESYIERLLEAGYRVAVADQVEDPDEVSGVVDRAVTRVVTPGTLTEDELLRSADNNYVACLTADGPGGDASTRDTRRAGGGAGAGGDEDGPYGLALLDVSTGDCYATGADRLDSIADELGRFAPAEAIVGPDAPADVFDGDCMVSPYERTAFDAERARERVEAYFGDLGLADEAEVRACGALLAYAEYTRGGNPDAGDVGDDSTAEVAGPGSTANDGGADDTDGAANAATTLDYINTLTRYDPREYMLLDRVALESLELFDRRAVHGDRALTLVDALDETACALGRRKLDDWLRRPLLDEDRIAARHDAVAELTGDVTLREALHDLLDDVYDIERLISRVARGRATARDLRSLHDTLAVVPDVEAALADADSATLVELREHLDPLADVRELVDEAIRSDPDADLTEGGIVEPEFDEELAALRSTEREGKAWIDDLEAGERERTGIDSLKVGHTSVHGYYIEVTDSNLDAVPDDYQRRQTLKNSERFVTPELREREDEIIRAEGRADDLEYELFCEVRREVAEESERVQALADRLARLDVFVSFASVAAKFDYTRPAVGAEEFAVEAGRHPVVERTEERFVPNDAHFDDEHFFAVVTGPNMSGKSTYMRQVALTSVLAQAGSFVPAAEARLPVVDRVFTRVGASDDIAGGRSTFMVEMTELADILTNATEDSLVLLDEVGRGTSTADGLAIARAVTEHVHDEVGATTLFATHHHELTAIADELSGVFNLHFETDRVEDEVTFEHEVAPGAAAASYGIEVAKLAGVPTEVVERSRELLEESDSGDRGEPAVDATGHDRDGNVRVSSTADGSGAGGAGSGPASDLERKLAALDVATMTPLEAMNALAELKESLDE